MKIFLLAVVCLCAEVKAQNAMTADLVEGGKTLVELIKIIKTPRMGTANMVTNNGDSCGSKKLADISFKNKTAKAVQVSLFLRAGNAYDPKPLTLSISPSSKETLYDIKSGIYKYKVETDEEGQKITLHEGELRLQSCEKLLREIRQ